MKGESVGNHTFICRKYSRGFSTLELIIAFALLSIILSGSIQAIFVSQYWTIVSETSSEALYKVKTKIEDLRAISKQDFYSATSSPLIASKEIDDPVDLSCIDGGLCYFVESNVLDISSCSKYIESKVEWKVENYPTTTSSLFSPISNFSEIIYRGGDCLLDQVVGDWKNRAPLNGGTQNFIPGKQFTSIDVLDKNIYATASTFPSFLIYDKPDFPEDNPLFLNSLDIMVSGQSRVLNSIDVIEDLGSMRTYAFVAVHATSSQLAVIDTTDPNSSSLVAERSLIGVTSSGSFPQGYRIFAYGNRLYITTRETAGKEFHIFDISNPAVPIEIGSGFELNRTVNELIVRDQKVGGVTKRLVFLAADSNLKEVGILDVTNDIVTEINSSNLAGNQDGLSLYLIGNNMYLGRASNSSGPELYVFDIKDPFAPLSVIGQGEVGANINSIKVSGSYAYIGTSKNGQEFQVWDSNFNTWNPSVQNSARFQIYNFPDITPLGFDIEENAIYAVSTKGAGDALQILYNTP